MPEPLQYESTEPTDPARRPALWVIYLIVFIDFLGFGIVIPLLPFYVPDYQDRPLTVTLLFSAYSICQFAGAPILGALSDRIGRKPVLVMSQFGSAAGFLLLGFATQFAMPAWLALTLVYVSRIVDGFTGGNVSTAQAYISDVTTPATRAKAMGLMGAAFGIGFAAGPAVGGLVGAYHVSYPAYLAAFFAGAAGLLSMFLLRESRTHRPAETLNVLHPSVFMPIFRQPVVAQLIWISTLGMCAFMMMETTMGMFLNATFGWEERQVGWFFTMIGVTIVLVQGGLVGRLTKLFGEWPLAIMGPMLVAVAMVGLVVVGWQPMVWLVLTAGILNAAGRSLQMPVISSLISQHTDPDRQGVAFGLYHSMMSMARVFGPIIAGLLYKVHHTAQYGLAGLMLAAAAVWTLSLSRRIPREAEPHPTPTEARAALASPESAPLGET